LRLWPGDQVFIWQAWSGAPSLAVDAARESAANNRVIHLEGAA
jgi:hypothetical protein